MTCASWNTNCDWLSTPATKHCATDTLNAQFCAALLSQYGAPLKATRNAPLFQPQRAPIRDLCSASNDRGSTQEAPNLAAFCAKRGIWKRAPLFDIPLDRNALKPSEHA